MRRRLAHALVVLAVTASVAIACTWPDGTSKSVRYNWVISSERELGRLPRFSAATLPALNAIDDDRFWHYNGEDDGTSATTGEEIDKLWDEATVTTASRDDLRDVRGKLREYLERTDRIDGCAYSAPKDIQKRRNSASDRLDAIGELDRGAAPKAVSEYLTARTALDSGDVLANLSPSGEDDPHLKDNARYLFGAFFYRQGAFDTAADTFASLVELFPRSEKREAATFMRGMAELRGSGGIGPVEAFETYLRQYPRGRYAVEARGWKAHVLLESDHRPEALAAYYRMLARPADAREIEIAVTSLRIERPKADDEEMIRVEQLLAEEPATALAYAYYELYNFAPRLGGDPWMERGAGAVARAKHDAAIERVAAFATHMADRTRGGLAAPFLLRIAMADFELGRDADAARLARRALTAGIGGEERLRGLFVAGCAEYRLGQYDTARRALLEVVASNGPFVEGARCNLALLAEDTGDLAGALEQYLALDYQLDVAFLVDVLMTPEQLAAFVDAHPRHPRRDAMLYALGVRYMRDKRFDEARAAYRRVRVIADEYPEWDAYYVEERHPAKVPGVCDWGVEGVRARWVARDMQTMDDIEILRVRVDAASDYETHAEALYQLASYYYEADELLFYNPEAWRGFRSDHLAWFGAAGLRTPGEAEAIWHHCVSHEPVAHALDIYIDVADRYPGTKAARDALASAVFSDERLASYNSYWRSAYDVGRHAGTRRPTYAEVRTKYPKYVWPLGNGPRWEPSTRTVNGKPAWPPKPKPIPPKPLWKRAADRGLPLLWSTYAWTYGAVTGFVARVIGYHVGQARLGLLFAVLLVSVYAGFRSWASAIPMAGRRPTRVAAHLVARAARDGVLEAGNVMRHVPVARGSILSTEAPEPDREERFWEWLGRSWSIAVHTRAGLALLLYALPASLLAVLLVALASRM